MFRLSINPITSRQTNKLRQVVMGTLNENESNYKRVDKIILSIIKFILVLFAAYVIYALGYFILMRDSFAYPISNC